MNECIHANFISFFIIKFLRTSHAKWGENSFPFNKHLLSTWQDFDNIQRKTPALKQLFSALQEKRLGWHPWWDHRLGFMLHGENYFLPRAEAKRFPDFSCPLSGPDPHSPEGWGWGGRWALGWSGQSQKELICWELHNRIGFWKHVRASSLHPGVKGQCKAAIGKVCIHWSSCE